MFLQNHLGVPGLIALIIGCLILLIAYGISVNKEQNKKEKGDTK
jgi:hypothetical protein